MLKRICVFCGSNAGSRPSYSGTAFDFGELLARQGIELVYGGGQIGLMGKLADGALHGGGKVTGVIPQALMDRELGHRGIQDLRVVGSMHERKALMASLSDGFVALPGGYGTFEEFCEILTWAQLGLHKKPFGILNAEGFYEHLLRMFDHAVEEGFLAPKHRAWVIEETDGARLLEWMKQFEPPSVEKWISKRES